MNLATPLPRREPGDLAAGVTPLPGAGRALSGLDHPVTIAEAGA